MRLAVVVVALLACAAPAQAATYCVDTSAPACVDEPTVAAALTAAADQPGTDTVRIGRRTESGDLSDANGEPVRIIGAGRDDTVLGGLVDLNEGGSGIAGLTVRNPGVRALALRGDGHDLLVDGDLRLRAGSQLVSSVVKGAVSTAGAVSVHSVLFAGAGIDVGAGELTARNVTLVGTGATGLRVIGGACATLTDSIVAGFGDGFSGPVSVTRSILPDSDPRLSVAFVPRASSPAVDAGDPDPLSASEPQEDAVGDVRAMDGDGDGDGVARRDIGAIERRPHSPPSTAGNLVANPGAEQGTAATDDRASPAPPHWTRTGAFTSVRYGTVAGPFAFPTLAAAVAVRGGRAFFAAGPGGAATLRQAVDVSRWAPEIDARSGAVVSLSALLGGFRASEDQGVVTAHFRGPFNSSRGAIALRPVSAAQRGNATMLMTRGARAVLPRLTRSVVVTVRAGMPGGSYNDAYVDNVALVPRIAPLRGLRGPRVRARRQFAGAAVLSPRVRVDRRRRARVRLGCPSAAVRGCAGVVTLVRSHTVILGARRVALRPGQIRRLRIQLSRRERRALAGRTPGLVYVAVRDGQGLTRTVTARVRIVPR